MLQVGDWVEIISTGGEMDGTICYVLQVDHEDGTCEIKGVRHPNGGRIGGKRWVEFEFVRSMKTGITIGELNDLIDWSLDEMDQKSFMYYSRMKNRLFVSS